MSELKRHHINEVMDMHNLTRGEMSYSFVYYADDIDRVIAEKDAEIRHHKYKRCLAMAERCKYRMYYLAAVVEQEASKIIPLKAQIQWYQKRESRMDYWKNRWLELAEKFKEAK